MRKLRRLTSAVRRHDIRGMIMLSALFAAILSTADQSKLAAIVMGWVGLQSYLLSGTVVLLEAVCLIVWNRAASSVTKWKAFWWAMTATAVSASLNVTYARLHWRFADVSEPLVWYLAIVPNLMLMASIKVGALLLPTRSQQEAAQEAETQQEAAQADTAEAEPLPDAPAELPDPPRREAEEATEPDATRQEELLPAPPQQSPADPTLWAVPRETVLICLAEIATRMEQAGPDAKLETVLDAMSGAWLEQKHGTIGKRGWNNAKRDAVPLWVLHRERVLALLQQRALLKQGQSA